MSTGRSRSWRPAQALGLRSVVDAMPIGAGRDAQLLAEVSRRSGVHVVAPTGLHHARHYPARHWTRDRDRGRARRACSSRTSRTASMPSTTTGPVVRRTAHRAGVIKIAGSEGGPSARDAADLRGRGHRPRARPAAPSSPTARTARGRWSRSRCWIGTACAAGSHRAVARGQGRRPGLPARRSSRRGIRGVRPVRSAGRTRRTARSSCSSGPPRTAHLDQVAAGHGRRAPGLLDARMVARPG